MRPLIIILSVMLLSLSSIKAQGYDFGISINPGFSTLIADGESGFGTKWVFSGNAGMFFNLQIGDNSMIGAELLYSVMGSKNIFIDEIYITDPTTSEKIILGNVENVVRSDIRYFALPIMYGLKKDKAQIRFGIQTMFASKGIYESTYTTTYNFSSQTTENNEDDIDGLNNLDFGFKFMFGYQIMQRAVLNIQYYRGLRKIGDIGSQFNPSNRQITLGLQYSLTKKNSTSEQ